MFHRRNQLKSLRQQGNMLVISIFVIIVMSLLGFAMTRILSASSDALIHEVFGLKAMNAAKAGLEVSIAQAFPVSGTATCNASLSSDSGFSSLSGMENCQYQVSCSTLTEGSVEYYRFSSVGTCQIDDVITSRTVAVDAKLE